MRLNQEQQEAVDIVEGAVLVLAGAGSGKTRVVTSRIIHLLDIGVPSYAILALTFTNKAAKEMRDRIQLMMHTKSPLICTFHSLGVRILRESIHHLGFSNHFTIYDEDDANKLIQTCLHDLGVKEKKGDVKALKNRISEAKNANFDPENIKLQGDADEELFLSVYKQYQTKLKLYNAVDFDDLLFLVVKLFKTNVEVLKIYQKRFSFLLVDEYQDTNQSQYEILNFLSGGHGNIFAVGDPDQSIYSWRGANIQNILNFEKDFKDAKIIRLEQNYRSTSTILKAANALISKNKSRFPKELWSELGKGEKIRRFLASDERHEASYIAGVIKEEHQKGTLLKDMAIFYRTNQQSRAFEDVLLQNRIPYTIIGGLSFYQRKEIKDILSFLRVVYSSHDWVSFVRSIHLPKRGLGDATLEKLRVAAYHKQMSILGYLQALLDGQEQDLVVKLSTKQKEAVKEYLNLIYQLKEKSNIEPLSVLVRQTIESTGYLSIIKEDMDTYDDRKGNLDALITKAIEWEEGSEDKSLKAFLEELSLKSSLDEAETDKDRISLMTLHNGKGLEFKVAFLAGLEEGLFPHINSIDSLSQLEEERRLCYVGITRAKQLLIISSARLRYIWGMQKPQVPSRFIKEIPEEYVEQVKISFIRPRIENIEPIDEEDMEELAMEPFYEYEIGSTVFHKDFGIGVIKDSKDSSLGLTYKIFFTKDNRERSIVAKYAKLRKL